MRIFVELDVDEMTLEGILKHSRHCGATRPPLVVAPGPPPGTGMVPETGWMRVKEASQYAAVSRSTIYEACSSRALRFARVGGAGIRLKREWIDAWMIPSDDSP